MTRYRISTTLVLLAACLFASAPLRGQYGEQKPNYPDEIVPLRGKPFKGKILKFDGTTLYVEITRHKIAQVIMLSVDSLLDVKKDFGPTQVTIWKREPPRERRRTSTASPSIVLPRHLTETVKRDTVAALAIEKDSIYVGSVDRKDTIVAQNLLVDQRPVPLVRANTDYPEIAKVKRMEGFVKLRLWIDKEGIPRMYKIVESTDSVFVETSVASAMKWEFSPALAKGTPVGVWASVSFEYRFQK